MSIKLQDFDSSFNDISLISSKVEANQSSAAYKQKQQTRALYLIYFLSCMNYSFSLSFSAIIFQQYLDKNHDENTYGLFDLSSYPIFTGACTSLLWGFASDRVGRKIALNISLIGSALTMILYGFSKSFNSVAFTNALFGIFSCNSIFIKTMIGENNFKISRHKVFRYLPIINMVAYTISPMITTPFLLSHLHDIELDRDTSSLAGFPYLIPCLIGSGISIAAYITSYYCLNETLAVKKSKNDGSVIADIPTNQKMTLEKSNQIGIFGLNFSKDSLLLLIGSSLLTLISKVYSRMSKNWPMVDSSKGGLNLKIEHIMVVAPLSSIIMVTILLKYSSICKKLSVLNQFKAGFPVVGVLFILSVIITLIAKIGSTFIILPLYAILFTIKSGITILTDISFDLLLTESAEISGNLGTLYGISSTLSGVISLIIIYASKSLSTLSTENNLPFPLNYKLTWLLAVLSLIGYWLNSKINNKPQPNQETTREHEH